MVKVDFHVHSHHSMDGISSLDELAMEASGQGLFALAICDHNRFTLTQTEVRHGVYLLAGCEISTTAGHILALFCHTPCDLATLTAHGLPSGVTAVEEIHRCGGLAVMAHPFASRHNENVDIPPAVDGIEVYNARGCFHHRDANLLALQYATNHHLLQFAGSDCHSKFELGNGYTLVDTSDLDGLRQAVEESRVTPHLHRNTPRTRKGLSQIQSSLRQKNPLSVIKSCVYWCYCLLLDMIKN